MTLSDADLRRLADVAIDAATSAGEMIVRAAPAKVDRKPGVASPAAQVVTDVDRHSESIILDRLRPTIERHGIGLLTEERADDESRRTAAYFWCVDPLDGTLPFVEGRPGSAVSIALVRHDGTPVIGVIFDLSENVVLHAIAGGGAFVDGRAWSSPPQRSASLAMYADRSFVAIPDADDVLADLDRLAVEAGLLGVDLRVGAGAVVNACSVLRSPPGCYLKLPARSGGGSVWDFAASACLFEACGSVVSDVFGAALDLNPVGSTFMHERGVLFATDADLARRLRELVARRR